MGIHRTSSLEVTKDRPSIVFEQRIHSRNVSIPLEQALRPPALVPFAWFLTTSTGFASLSLRIYFTSLPILGFIAFPTATKQFSPQCVSALQSFLSSGSDIKKHASSFGERSPFLFLRSECVPVSLPSCLLVKTSRLYSTYGGLRWLTGVAT